MLKESVKKKKKKAQGSQQKFHLIHLISLDFESLKSALGKDPICAVGRKAHFPGSRE